MIDNGIVDIEKYLKDKFDYSFNGDLDEFYNKKFIKKICWKTSSR